MTKFDGDAVTGEFWRSSLAPHSRTVLRACVLDKSNRAENVCLAYIRIVTFFRLSYPKPHIAERHTPTMPCSACCKLKCLLSAVRGGRAKGPNLRKDMEVFQKTGKHPEVEAAKAAQASTIPALPDRDVHRPHVFMDFKQGDKLLGSGAVLPANLLQYCP